MVPTKTIYVREADAEIWDEAEKLAGGSVSALITEALRRYVEEEKLKERSGMEKIRVELWRSKDDETPYEAEFVGRWLVYPDRDETRTGERFSSAGGQYDAGAYWGVALTRRGKIAVYTAHCNDGFAPMLDVYDSFEKAEEAGEPSDILAMAAAEMGADYVQKLDI